MLRVIYNHQNVKSLLKCNDDFLEIIAKEYVHPVYKTSNIQPKTRQNKSSSFILMIFECRNTPKILWNLNFCMRWAQNMQY